MAHILIVEDDPASGQLLLGMLRQQQHEADLVCTIEDGWKCLTDNVNHDMVFLDNHLGETFGWELLARMRKSLIFRAIPVAVYTGRGDRASILRYIELGVQNILTKPYSVDKVVAELERAKQVKWRASFLESLYDVAKALKTDPERFRNDLLRAARYLESSAEALRESSASRDWESFTNRLQVLAAEANKLAIPVLHWINKAIQDAHDQNNHAEMEDSIGMLVQLATLLKVECGEYKAPKVEEPEEESTPSDDEPTYVEAPPPVAEGKAKRRDPGRMPKALLNLNIAKFATQAPMHAFAAEFKMLCESQVIPLNALLYEVEHMDERPILDAFGKTLRLLKNFDRRSMESLQAEARTVGLGPERLRRILMTCERQISKDPLLQQFMDMITPVRTGAYLCLLHWMQMLATNRIALRLEAMAVRQLLAATIAREMADPEQQNFKDELERAAVLRLIGQWLQALLYPGLFGLRLCLEEKGGEAAESLELRLLGTPHRELGSRFLQALNEDRGLAQIVLQQNDLAGLSGRTAILGAWVMLGYQLADMVLARGRPDNGDHLQRAFLESPAWKILAADSRAKERTPVQWLREIEPMVPTLAQPIAAVFLSGTKAAAEPVEEVPVAAAV